MSSATSPCARVLRALGRSLVVVCIVAACAGPGELDGRRAGLEGAATCVAVKGDVLFLLDASKRTASCFAWKTAAKKTCVQTRWAFILDAFKKTLPKFKDFDIGVLAWPYVAVSDKPPAGLPRPCGVSADAPVFQSLCVEQTASPPGEACGAPDLQSQPSGPYGQSVSALEHVEPAGHSPVTSALVAAYAWYKGSPSTGHARNVVLFVDGPDDCTDPARAASMVQQLRKLGVDVWVAAFKDSPDPAWLSNLAEWGGHPRPAKLAYYVLESVTDFNALMLDVRNSVGSEVCDGADNDCDGAIDESLTRACPAACGGGVQACAGGAWQACGAAGSSGDPFEGCDGIDNDCDGLTDEGFLLGDPCQATLGACSTSGVVLCDPSTLGAMCSAPAPVALPETCNGVDDDCDGALDEGTDVACDTACRHGWRHCSGGKLGACELEPPSKELCDGWDNDCDGEVDEGYDVGAPCLFGPETCERPSVRACAADGQATVCAAVPIEVSDEVCNDIDDDCDGTIDDGELCGSDQVCFAGQCIWD